MSIIWKLADQAHHCILGVVMYGERWGALQVSVRSRMSKQRCLMYVEMKSVLLNVY